MTEPFTDEDKRKARGCAGALVVLAIVAGFLAYNARTRTLDVVATSKCSDEPGRACDRCCSQEHAKSSRIRRRGNQLACECLK